MISRLESVNATPAASFQSGKEVGVSLKYCALVFSRSCQVFRNLSNNLVGGLSSSKNYKSGKHSRGVAKLSIYLRTGAYVFGWTHLSGHPNAWIMFRHSQGFAKPVKHCELRHETPNSGGIPRTHCIQIQRKNLLCFPQNDVYWSGIGERMNLI